MALMDILYGSGVWNTCKNRAWQQSQITIVTCTWLT